jgi:putative transposase
MPYDSQKHHRRSIRLAEYDYSKGGAYFITICTRNGEPILANAQKPGVNVWVALAATHPLETPPNPESDSVLQFELTPIGEIVDHNWRMLPVRFSMVSLDEYFIMPNHLHGIMVINESDQSQQRDAGKRVGARPTPTVPKTPTLGMIVGSFKSMLVKDVLAYIKENRLDMIGKIWQRNYFERVIRNERDLENIRTYIRNNPVNWDQDDENPKRIRRK